MSLFVPLCLTNSCSVREKRYLLKKLGGQGGEINTQFFPSSAELLIKKMLTKKLPEISEVKAECNFLLPFHVWCVTQNYVRQALEWLPGKQNYDSHRKTILFRCSKRKSLWILTFFPFRGRIKLFTELSRAFWAGIPEVKRGNKVLRCAVAYLLSRLVDPKFRCRSKLLKSPLLVCFQVLYYSLILKNNPNVTEYFSSVASIYIIDLSFLPAFSFIHILCKMFHKKRNRKYKFHVLLKNIFPLDPMYEV